MFWLHSFFIHYAESAYRRIDRFCLKTYCWPDNIMKICPLCKNSVESFHPRSHTLPEWMYKEIYDESHKINQVSRIDQAVIKKQKGHHASYICSACEEKTQKLDHYASLILTDRSPQSPEKLSIQKKITRVYDGEEKIEFEEWSGVDFIKFQGFVFSVILRCNFAGMIQGAIKLTEKHLNRIIELYNNNEFANDYSYPIILRKFNNPDKSKDLVVMPYFMKDSGHHVITFAGGGYCFNIYISSHLKPDFVDSLCLKSNGRIHVVMESMKKTEMYRRFAETMHLINSKKGQQNN